MSLEAAYHLRVSAQSVTPPATPLSHLEQDGSEPPLSEELPGERRRHIAATTAAILIHALILLLLLWIATAPTPARLKNIPVQIVRSLPPKPPAPKPAQKRPEQPRPQEQPKQQAEKPPPPPQKTQPRPQGPLASDDLGNPDAAKDSHLFTDAPAAGPATPQEGTEQTHDTGAADLASPNDTPTPGALGDKSKTPKPVEEPVRKKGGSKFSMANPKSPHAPGHYARLAGPSASKDEYLAYLKERLEAHRAMVGPAVTQGRHGVALLTVTLLPSGHVNFVVVQRSSGFKDVDQRIVQMVYAMGDLPKVPPELLTGDDLPADLLLRWPF